MAASSFLSIALALLLAGQQCDAMFGLRSKTSYTLLDKDELKFSKAIVDQICAYNHQSSHVINMFSKVSSIEWLNDNFVDISRIPSLNSDQVACLADYEFPLSELMTMIYSLDEDACAGIHIDLVETFHKKYIEPLLIPSKQAKAPPALPEPLKWFFIHYAHELSHQCQSNLVDNLELMGKSSKAQSQEILGGVEGGKFLQASEKLFKEDGENQKGFGLIWSMIDRLSRKYNQQSIAGDWNRLTGDTIRLRLMIKEAGPIRSIQEKCRNELRPVYSETALPVMRLVDMGYNTAETFVQTNKQVQNWFGIVQTCEYLLGIETYEKPTLNPEEIRVISWEDAVAMHEGKDTTVYEPITFEKKPAGEFDILVAYRRIEENPSKLLKLIRKEAELRIKRFKRALRKSLLADRKTLANNLKFSSKSKLGKLGVDAATWSDSTLEESSSYRPNENAYYNYGDQGERPQYGMTTKKQTFGEWMSEAIDENPFFWCFVAPALSFLLLICLVGLIG